MGQAVSEEHIYFKDEVWPRRFDKRGLVATANRMPNRNSSSFFITLREDGKELKEFRNVHTIFGQVVEGLDVLLKINDVHTVGHDRPLQNIRIKHCMIIEDPFEEATTKFGIELGALRYPSRSPSPVRGLGAKSMSELRQLATSGDADDD